MIIDITADILEQAVKVILTGIAEVLNVSDSADVPDDYIGFIVQIRHRENTIMTNDGKLPVVSVYEMEIVRKVLGDVDIARRENSGATLATLFQGLQASVDALLEDGLQLNIINVTQTQEDIATTDTQTCWFTNVYDVTCQPLIVEEI
jgi:hypothetical protein